MRRESRSKGKCPSLFRLYSHTEKILILLLMRLYHIEREYNQDPARTGLCVLYLRTETEEFQLITETEYTHNIKFILKKRTLFKIWKQRKW